MFDVEYLFYGTLIMTFIEHGVGPAEFVGAAREPLGDLLGHCREPLGLLGGGIDSVTVGHAVLGAR
ncbi:MAG TPA: hypothetical protein VN961_15150, partial [Streptosporangiaceae bacterium]|nr:hypothetical protein [Streptosporangiaceae bacterium]